MFQRMCLLTAILAVTVIGGSLQAADSAAPDYTRDIAPIFQKYCNGCHNAEDAEGKLNLESYAGLSKGGENGPALIAGDAAKSRLLLLVTKQAEPFMPPDDNVGPNADEIALLRTWITAGAKDSKPGTGDPAPLVTPKIAPTGDVRKPISAVAWSPNGQWIAVARYAGVQILDGKTQKPLTELTDINGQVNAVSFSADSSRLVVAAGEPGLFGEATLWNTADWKSIRRIRGHRDSLYTAEISPDGTLLATGSYDQKINLWNTTDGTHLRELAGHNGPVFDLAFHPTGRILASASGDRTIKLWDVTTGERLDTLIEPTKEQYTVAFHPDGRALVAGGVDNRIRVWTIRQMGQEGTNPIQYARFAHEGPIINLSFTPNGNVLISSSEDRRIKLWETDSYTQQRMLDEQPDWTPAIAIAPDNATMLVGRLDGTMTTYTIDATGENRLEVASPLTALPIPAPHTTAGTEVAPLKEIAESEPNDEPAAATTLSAPGVATGILQAGADRSQDADLFRFSAQAGQTWMIETKAFSEKSPTDTHIEVLHADGSPVLRMLFRAVRDSFINFRPIDSSQTQVRVDYWEEMDLNQFLYMSGEVGKFFRMPRGPDSGMEFYAQGGKRRCYFDTSPTIHALADPIYIVEPYLPGAKFTDNGLPVFQHFYANDDDGDRKLGADSQLMFTAPADGEFLVRVTDVRGFSGPDYKYKLTIREPRPDFKVSIAGKNPKVAPNSGQRLKLNVDRIDGFTDEIRVDIANLPPGFSVATPVVIEPDHLNAETVINATADATAPTKEQWSQVKVTATADINGQTVRHEVGDLGEIKLAEAPKVLVVLEPDTGTDTLTTDDKAATASDRDTAATTDTTAPDAATTTAATTAAQEIVITPGTTITAMLRIQRSDDFKGELKFDVDNLPHGVIVDNIGLSGILIREGETERQIFFTAAKWVPESTRWIHAVANGQGNQSSRPILFHVRQPDDVKQAAR